MSEDGFPQGHEADQLWLKDYRTIVEAVGAGCALDGWARFYTVREFCERLESQDSRFQRGTFAVAVELAAHTYCEVQGVELSPRPSHEEVGA